MNPLTRECFGLYGYGSGYFAREANQTAISTKTSTPAFCEMCRVKTSCWGKLRAIVEQENPEAVKAFNEQLKKYSSGGELAVKMLEEGTPDPWMTKMFNNFSQGNEDRE